MEDIIKHILIITVMIVIINILVSSFGDFIEFLKNQIEKLKMKLLISQRINEQNLKEKNKVIYKYYGLFEFKFENCNDE